MPPPTASANMPDRPSVMARVTAGSSRSNTDGAAIKVPSAEAHSILSGWPSVLNHTRAASAMSGTGRCTRARINSSRLCERARASLTRAKKAKFCAASSAASRRARSSACKAAWRRMSDSSIKTRTLAFRT